MSRVVIVAMILVVSACGGVEDVRLTGADAGATVDVAMGRQVDVGLEANITTGYEWVVESVDETVLRPAAEAIYDSDAPPDVTGAGGTFMWTFDAVGEGSTDVRLAYLRPWEDQPPAETFTFTVRVSR